MENVYVSFNGLSNLVYRGMDKFEKKHRDGEKGVFPYNLVHSNFSGRLMLGSAEKLSASTDGYRMPVTEADQLLKEYGRIGGWLAAAAELPTLARVIKKTQSHRGMHSPRTRVKIPKLWEKFPSPGNLERKLQQVRTRALQILKAYDGDYIPSWASIANALLRETRIGKAAIMAVAETLTLLPHRRGERVSFAGYRPARDFLASVRTAGFPVILDEETRREGSPIFSKMGIRVYRARVSDAYGRFDLRVAVEADGYHTIILAPSTGASHRDCIRWAVQRWKLDKDVRQKLGFGIGDQVKTCVVVYDHYGRGRNGGLENPATFEPTSGRVRSWKSETISGKIVSVFKGFEPSPTIRIKVEEIKSKDGTLYKRSLYRFDVNQSHVNKTVYVGQTLDVAVTKVVKA